MLDKSSDKTNWPSIPPKSPVSEIITWVSDSTNDTILNEISLTKEMQMVIDVLLNPNKADASDLIFSKKLSRILNMLTDQWSWPSHPSGFYTPGNAIPSLKEMGTKVGTSEFDTIFFSVHDKRLHLKIIERHDLRR